DLGLAACEVDELAGVGDVARAGDADVVVGLVHLLDALALHQWRAEAFVDGEDDAVVGLDADARGAALDGLAGVLDLVESPVRREDRYPAVVGLLLGLSLHSFRYRVLS